MLDPSQQRRHTADVQALRALFERTQPNVRALVTSARVKIRHSTGQIDEGKEARHIENRARSVRTSVEYLNKLEEAQALDSEVLRRTDSATATMENQEDIKTEQVDAETAPPQEAGTAQPTTAEERGEVEQAQTDVPAAGPPAVESNDNPGITNGTSGEHSQQNGTKREAFDLPIRNKESEHTEKVVSAIEEDPATLEAPGIVEAENDTTGHAREAAPEAPAAPANETPVMNGDAPATEQTLSPQANGTTPSKSPRVPAYLKTTAASASKSSPKPSPSSRNGSMKAPSSSSKLNASLRKASDSKSPTASTTAPTTGSPASKKTRSPLPARKADLSHLTAPTAASAARKEPTPAPANGLGRAMSVRSKKPVEGSSFLAPTASSAHRKDVPSTSNGTSSLGRSGTVSKRERPTPGPAAPSSRKVSATARPSLPTTERPATTARVASSSSTGKPAAGGSFLDRMTRPTAASSGRLHEKNDGAKSPAANGKAGGLGRAASVRNKVGGAAEAAGRKLGLRGKSGLSVKDEKKVAPNGVKAPAKSSTNGEVSRQTEPEPARAEATSEGVTQEAAALVAVDGESER